MRDPIIFQKPDSTDRRKGASRQSLATGLHSVLQNSLRRNELIVHYQPRIDSVIGRISGMEALVRWRHPHMGMVEPERFIPVAEETGMIAELGEWVLFTALATHHQWTEAGLSPGIIAVNVSPKQLTDPGFADLVKRLSELTGVQAIDIELEITESIRLDNLDQVVRNITELQEFGIKFAMDDFGAGYASLDYVRKLPLDAVKIDQSFIRNITENNQDALLVKGMVSLATDLGLNIVAEGIETTGQLDILRPLACNEFQGFLFSRPISREDATALLGRAHTYAV